MPNWIYYAKAFQYLCSKSDGGKSSDGVMSVVFLNDKMYNEVNEPKIRVDLYAYCMPLMSRHHQIGPFENEDQAKSTLKDLLLVNAIEMLNNSDEDILQIDKNNPSISWLFN